MGSVGSWFARQDFVLYPWELGGCLKLLGRWKSPRRVKASFGSAVWIFLLGAFGVKWSGTRWLVRHSYSERGRTIRDVMVRAIDTYLFA